MKLDEIAKYTLPQFKSEIGDQQKERSHALTSRRKDWEKHPELEVYLAAFDYDDITISRQQLYDMAPKDTQDMILYATIWGYYNDTSPGGTNIKKSVAVNSEKIRDALDEAAKNGIPNWKEHYKNVVSQFKGVGISTYSKFLTFKGIMVEGVPALIIDRHVGNVIRSGDFDEFNELKKITPDPARNREGFSKNYAEIVKGIHKVAAEVGIPAPNLEMFMYQWNAQKGKLRRELLKRMNLESTINQDLIKMDT